MAVRHSLPPRLDEAALEGFDPADDGSAIALAERPM